MADLISVCSNQKRLNFKDMVKMNDADRSALIEDIRTCRESFRLEQITCIVNQCFTDCEEQGVKIFQDVTQQHAQRYRNKREKIFEIARAISERVEDLRKTSPPLINKKLQSFYQELQRREIGLKYSLGDSNGYLKTLEVAEPKCLKKLIRCAKAWKKQQILAIHEDLDRLELEQLRELAKYPEWTNIVMKDGEYLNQVFNWCLRDFNQPEVIIKCYETHQRIKKALLSSNLGNIRRAGNEILSFYNEEGINTRKRVLTACFYHGNFNRFEPAQQEKVNILKPNQAINFKRGNYRTSIKEIFDELAKKNFKEAKVNLCAWGFVNFHPTEVGYWDEKSQKYLRMANNITEENWYDFIPLVALSQMQKYKRGMRNN